jgi:hypothetical protein
VKGILKVPPPDNKNDSENKKQGSDFAFFIWVCQIHNYLILFRMSPTIFRHKGYRFFFFSREENVCIFMCFVLMGKQSSG